MRTRLTQISVEDAASGFTGREGMKGYDPTKPYKLYELNRDFVWDDTRQEGFIISILAGYPIPPILICNGSIVDGGNRITTLWRFKNNQFSVKINGVDYTYETLSSNRELIRMWDKSQVPIVEGTEATNDDISNIYQNWNSGVKLLIGQLLENRKHIPIVNAALSIIGRAQDNSIYPYRDLTSRVWNKIFTKTKNRTEIAFAFQLLVGTMYGPHHFHTSFERHVQDILITEKASKVDFTRLGILLEMIDDVDPENVVPRTRKSLCFRKFAGAIIHDMWDDSMPILVLRQKWTEMFRKAYNVLEKEHLKCIFDVGTDRAKNDTRIKAVSINVQKFLDGKLEMQIADSSTVDSEEESD
jgi:hypothetical protein